MPGKTRRIDRGYGHSYLLDGGKCDGVTTILGEGYPKPFLVGWAAKTVAEYVANRLTLDPDDRHVADRLIADLRELASQSKDARRHWKDGPPGPLTIADTLKGVTYADRDAAGRRGTEVHVLAQAYMAGEKIQIPEALEGHVASYVRFVEEWKPTHELVERTVINRQHRYMGTLDLIADLVGLGRCLVDLKTGRTGIYAETALQQAAYRNAETLLEPDGTEIPMPEVDGCYALWVRADGYDLVPVEAGPREYRTFLYMQQVAAFRKTEDDVIGEALSVGASR